MPTFVLTKHRSDVCQQAVGIEYVAYVLCSVCSVCCVMALLNQATAQNYCDMCCVNVYFRSTDTVFYDVGWGFKRSLVGIQTACCFVPLLLTDTTKGRRCNQNTTIR